MLLFLIHNANKNKKIRKSKVVDIKAQIKLVSSVYVSVLLRMQNTCPHSDTKNSILVDCGRIHICSPFFYHIVRHQGIERLEMKPCKYWWFIYIYFFPFSEKIGLLKSRDLSFDWITFKPSYQVTPFFVSHLRQLIFVHWIF